MPGHPGRCRSSARWLRRSARRGDVVGQEEEPVEPGHPDHPPRLVGEAGEDAPAPGRTRRLESGEQGTEAGAADEGEPGAVHDDPGPPLADRSQEGRLEPRGPQGVRPTLEGHDAHRPVVPERDPQPIGHPGDLRLSG